MEISNYTVKQIKPSEGLKLVKKSDYEKELSKEIIGEDENKEPIYFKAIRHSIVFLAISEKETDYKEVSKTENNL